MSAIITKRHPNLIPHTHSLSDLHFIKTYNSNSSVNIGDVVYISQTLNNYVYTNIDNKEESLSVGIVIEKPTTILSVVQLYGDCNLTFIGLEKGKRVWISPIGGLTTQLPIEGYVHIIGICYEDNKIFINPELSKLKRNPF